MHDFAGDDISAYFGVTPAIMITGDASPNAYVTQVNEIVLSRGLLGMLSSNSELAFVVAHELGHIMLGHNSPQNGRDARFAFTGNAGHVENQIQREIEADRFALKLLNSSGFDIQSSVSLLARLSQSGKEHGAALGESYPSLGARLAALQNQIFAEHCGTF
ncbi:MAG: M48 family metalloprotease [Deltaproteobacteria bacterium]|nr:M48 family metalloprotease [Deltaproteobacteria bacterium]